MISITKCRKYRVRNVYFHPEFEFNTGEESEESPDGSDPDSSDDYDYNYDYDIIEEHRNPSLNDIALLKLSKKTISFLCF